MDRRRGQSTFCCHLAERRGGAAAALRGDLLRPRRYGKPHQGMSARPACRPHLGSDDAGQPAASVVRLDGLCADLRAAAHCSAADPIRQSDLRHDPSQAPQDRRAGAHQLPARQIRHGLKLPLSVRLRPRPRAVDQCRGALTNQRASAAIFDPANCGTTPVPARTRTGCDLSSPQCQRVAAAIARHIAKRYEKSALELARLASLACEIGSEDYWPQRLSGGEQQRLAIARALLDKPDWLFLDEATSALDEKLEAEIYRILSEVLPSTTIVSVGHRSTLIALHRRHIEMEPDQGGMYQPTPTIGVGPSARHAAMD